MGSEAKQTVITEGSPRTQVPASLSALFGHDGNIAEMRRAQYHQAKMRGLGPLWKHSEEFVDDAITRIGREGLVIAADRIDMNRQDVPNWLAIPELTSHKVSESRAAQRGMVPGSRGETGIQDKTPYTIPLYVTWDEFSFNVRELMAAERVGRPLDDDEIEQAVRNVNYAIEDAIINGGPTVGGNSTPGFSSTTNTDTFESNTKWDDAGKTGAEILTDVLALRALLAADKFYGPYTLYVPTEYGAALQKPFDSTGITSITRQQYLETLTFGNRELRVRTADLLPDDTVYLVQDTDNAVDVVVGQQPVAVMPAPEHEWHAHWTVFACIVPRVKSDYDGNFGIAKGTDS